MTHQEHVALLKKAVEGEAGTWADLGSGEGAFTLALADLLQAGSKIFSVDYDQEKLRKQKQSFVNLFPKANVEYTHADFTTPLSLPLLDGIIMANSLHFLKEKTAFLKMMKTYLTENGKFVLIEYNTDSGNPWVPYPISFQSFTKLTQKTGFSRPELLSTIPSRFLNEIYSAFTLKSG